MTESSQPVSSAAAAVPPSASSPMMTTGTTGMTGIEENKDARTWGMLAHLSALVGLVIPFGFIIGPLVVWLIKKNEMPFVDDQGKEALNFQITLVAAIIVCFVLMFVLIGMLLLPIVGIAGLVLTIIAAMKANQGIAYRYPFAIRLIK